MQKKISPITLKELRQIDVSRAKAKDDFEEAPEIHTPSNGPDTLRGSKLETEKRYEAGNKTPTIRPGPITILAMESSIKSDRSFKKTKESKESDEVSPFAVISVNH